MKKKIINCLIITFLSLIMIGVTVELDTLQLISNYFCIHMIVLFTFIATFFLYEAVVTAKKLEKSLRE